MVTVLLLYFHQMFGPMLFLSAPDKPSKEIVDKVKGFIDLNLGTSFFEVKIYELKLKTINLYITIKSNVARGQQEMALLSIVTDKNYPTDLFQEPLKNLAEKITSTSNMYKAFYIDDKSSDKDPEVSEKYKYLNEILSETSEIIKNKIETSSLGTLLVLGLSKVGKTTIIERITTKKFVDTKPTLTAKLLDLILESYRFKALDVSGQKKLRSQWWSYIKSPNAVIFVLDINEKGERLEETREEFKTTVTKILDIEKSAKTKTILPILIYANKIDLAKNPSVEQVEEMLQLKKYKVTYTIQLTSALTGEGIEDGVKKLINKLMEIAQ